MASFRAFLNSPVGQKITHFWGPVANWGFVAIGLADMNKPPEMISSTMTAGHCPRRVASNPPNKAWTCTQLLNLVL